MHEKELAIPWWHTLKYIQCTRIEKEQTAEEVIYSFDRSWVNLKECYLGDLKPKNNDDPTPTDLN